VDLERQQLIGIQLASVEKASGLRNLRTVGRVTADETRIYIINATVDGWITTAQPSATGSYVKKNEVLASFYSPEFLSAGQALLYALSSMDRVQATGKENPAQKDQIAQFNVNLQQYKDSLRNLGMGQVQIEEMIRTRKYMENVDITSPADGFILARKVSNGLRFAKGDEMYRIGDLSHVWILVDIFEQEEKYLRPGDRVRVTVPNQGTEVTARVTNVLPQFDPDSRTLKVRLEADNPGFRLRPDMFVDVELPVSEPSGITVPADAVIDTGRKKRVFVSRGNGYFESRDIETGWRFGGKVEVLKGLMEGERIVVSGTFLIDSESRMKAAASGIYGESAKDPVCGMDVDEGQAKTAGRVSEYQGVTYYFCADMCKQDFDRNPAKYLKKSTHSDGDRQNMPKM
jgi:membrane fusion protein, copper/silver efflux system